MKNLILSVLILPLLFSTQIWAQSTELYVKDFSIKPGEQYELKVFFKGDVYVTQAQFYLDIPEGFDFVNVGSARRPVYANNTPNSVGLAVSANLPSDINGRQLAVVMSDAEQIGTEDTEGELAIIYIRANEDIETGDYFFKMSNIVASDENAVVYKTEDFNIKVNVKSQDPITITYSMHPSGVGTLILPFKADVPEGCQVFSAIDVVDNVITLEKKEVIDAGVPLIFMGQKGEYLFTGVPSFMGNQAEAELLIGTCLDTTISSGYVLQTQNEVTGFYQVKQEAPVMVTAYHCWLNYASDAEVLRFNELIDGVTSYGQHKEKVQGWYDMQGRKKKYNSEGIHIIKGKKIIIKH